MYWIRIVLPIIIIYFTTMFIIAIIQHDYVFLTCFSVYLTYVLGVLGYAIWLNPQDYSIICCPGWFEQSIGEVISSRFYRNQDQTQDSDQKPEDIRYYNMEYYQP